VLNKDIFAIQKELETIKSDVQRLHAWLGVAVGRLEKRIEHLEIGKASMQASELNESVKRRTLTRVKQ